MRYSTLDNHAALAGFYYTLERVVYLKQEDHQPHDAPIHVLVIQNNE